MVFQTWQGPRDTSLAWHGLPAVRVRFDQGIGEFWDKLIVERRVGHKWQIACLV